MIHPSEPPSAPRASAALALASAFSLACALALAACGDAATGAGDTDIEATQTLKDLGAKVIFATYQDLEAKSGSLADAVAAFKASKSASDLEASKQAWKNARRPWEQSEAFLFGPVESKGIDPSIDSWPVNKVDLDGVLAGSAALTKEYIDAQEGTLKGFHTMEYLLFGQGDAKTAAQFTDRELEYLASVTLSFQAAVTLLKSSWDPAAGDYADTLATAGQGSVVYPSQKSALQELVKGMAGICDEVANGKIGEPFSQSNRALEESQFSDNSNADFADNIRSAQNLYLGQYGSSVGSGLSSVVADINPALDARVKAELQAAIDAIGRMTPTFGEAIAHNKAQVTAAQDAVLKVKATLEADVLPLFN